VAWTVNDADLMRRFAEWGVDAICTDDVALARATFRA
jgi:glycerophosphoryl diester phosphodiesterase